MTDLGLKLGPSPVTFQDASVPEIGLQRSTWRTRTFMFRSFHATAHSCGSRSKDEHISTRSCPSGCPCRPVSSWKLRRQLSFPWESREFAFSTTRILNYLDDWLILAQSQDQLCEHRDLVLSHLSRLGLRVNWVKSKLSPMQRISFLGMELDSVEQTARLTEECAQSVLNCLNMFKSNMQHSCSKWNGCVFPVLSNLTEWVVLRQQWLVFLLWALAYTKKGAQEAHTGHWRGAASLALW